MVFQWLIVRSDCLSYFYHQLPQFCYSVALHKWFKCIISIFICEVKQEILSFRGRCWLKLLPSKTRGEGYGSRLSRKLLCAQTQTAWHKQLSSVLTDTISGPRSGRSEKGEVPPGKKAHQNVAVAGGCSRSRAVLRVGACSGDWRISYSTLWGHSTKI